MKTGSLIEDIRSRLDIIDVISDYVELKKAGQNYKAICPFHSEKTPSFIVSPSKQIFHCFGCHSGGDIFGFVMKYENLNFQEASKILAKKAGIKLSGYKFESGLNEKKEKLLKIQKEALNLFKENLKKSKAAQAYFQQREIRDKMIDLFSLGFADKEWNTLYEHLKKNGVDDVLITQAGLVFTGDKGPYDMFRNRLMFPIFNFQGEAVAFGGRAIDDSMPKYLNSPETIIFKKSETLYGLNIAKDEIRKKNYAVITEGYLDVIMCHQHGFKNVVAPLGTALTPGHLQRLGRLTKKILLVFDGDSAGISAAKRSVAILYEHGFKSKILILPEGDDPDSFLRKNGARAFQARLANSKSMVEFILGLKGEKTDNVRTAIELISNTKDLILKEELIRELAEKSRIRESVIRGEHKKFMGKEKKSPEPQSPKLSYNEDVMLLSAIVSFPDKASYIFENLDIKNVRTPDVKKIFHKLRPIADGLNLNKILSALEEEEKSLITKLSLHPGFDVEYVDKNIMDCLRKIAHHDIEDQIKNAKTSGDLQLLNKLLIEKQKMMRGEDDRAA